ncbi:dephospho-CoA kinase/protein folding accessory domain-containing protein [Legionella pneumophila]|uniref:GNAT family N-acetyltransferase n=1 Tax=Legionella pneumophila TaxID=446 RepID=UPI0007709F3D|nr:GNAT family N-acetyltransferase [Legionella pneumophila]CZP95420.1 dephospho-CoA kinase/protein folding accessory domain-containing protein [Legionella pneumophila]
MFKVDWEKTSLTYQLPEGMAEKMVRLAYPDKKLTSTELIAGGCANLNVKIQLENENQPLILRVYLRDQDAAYREQKLAALIKETVPAPLTHYIGELEGHHFAITEFIPGLSLRDLLLGDVPHDLSAIMHEVGLILSKITAHEFSEAGFLNKELEVVTCESSDVIKFAQDCLNDRTVVSVLDPSVIAEIKQTIEQHASLFATGDEQHLVHGDFDPANILVDKINGSWIVTGILDWEFAFSGSYLWDVANMLRYAHKMPPEFQNSFIDALQRNGIKLPPDWRTTTHLLNLSSLLDLLKRSDPQRHPNRCADIRELIDHILSELNNMQKIDRIEIKPYDPNWPNAFEKEAALIKKALADNCVAIHHVGSTSVPSLAAKPKIDIIAVVRNLFFDKSQLEAIGYKYRGGFNIPLRRSFTIRTADRNINLHVFEENDPEIELNILFRDHLRESPSARDEYALLKYKLIAEESSHEKNDSIYRGYTLGKHDFIQRILNQSSFNKRRFVLCTHHSEWAAAKHFRDTYFFGPHGIDDPYTWTFTHEEHAHLVLYQGTEIVAYAHIQFWPYKRAAIRIIATDENKRNQSFGSRFLTLIEKWLRSLGVKSIHAESRQSSLRFYLKNSYTKMPFDDPENHESDPNDVPVGKVL